MWSGEGLVDIPSLDMSADGLDKGGDDTTGLVFIVTVNAGSGINESGSATPSITSRALSSHGQWRPGLSGSLADDEDVSQNGAEQLHVASC